MTPDDIAEFAAYLRAMGRNLDHMGAMMPLLSKTAQDQVRAVVVAHLAHLALTAYVRGLQANGTQDVQAVDNGVQ